MEFIYKLTHPFDVPEKKEPIVRCRDCKHFEEYESLGGGYFECGYLGTTKGGFVPEPDDFCSRGAKVVDHD